MDYTNLWESQGNIIDILRSRQDLLDTGNDNHDFCSIQPKNRWSGGTMQDAIDFMARGWGEGIKRIDTALATLDADIEDRTGRVRVSPQMDGAYPDVSRYIAGEPEHMMRFYKPLAPMRICSIAMNISTFCDVAAEHMLARAVAVGALIDHIENTGTRVELDVMCPVSDHGMSTYTTIIPIKSASQPLDLSACAFAAHPMMLRRVIFALEEEAPRHLRDQFGFSNMGGYGRPIKVPPDLRGNYTVIIQPPKDWDYGYWHNDEARWLKHLQELWAAGVKKHQEELTK